MRWMLDDILVTTSMNATNGTHTKRPNEGQHICKWRAQTPLNKRKNQQNTLCCTSILRSKAFEDLIYLLCCIWSFSMEKTRNGWRKLLTEIKGDLHWTKYFIYSTLVFLMWICVSNNFFNFLHIFTNKWRQNRSFISITSQIIFTTIIL